MSLSFEMVQIPFRDGYVGAGRFWAGTGQAVLYLHGIQSHGLWFEQSAGALNRLGCSVLLADRRGSGLNEPSRGHVDRYTHWIADAIDGLDWLKARTGRDRAHVIGVSWGGKLAMALARVTPERLASLTLVAPGLFPAVDVSLGDKFAIALSLPIHPKKLFPIPLNEPELFTANPVRQTFIRGDKLRLTQVTAKFLFQSRRLDGFIRRIPERLNLPVKLFLAGHERIIDNVKTIRYFRALRNTGPKQLAFYPHASHTLEFEPDNTPFLNDLQEWIRHVTNR